MQVIKAHAYGNDFLLASPDEVAAAGASSAVAQALCARHTGIGADGLMLVSPTARGAATRLFNADGSPSEISGNGIRCVAAWLAQERHLDSGDRVVIETDAGERPIDILERVGARVTCRAGMGPLPDARVVTLDVAAEAVPCVVLNMGNPQCVVLGPAEHLTQRRLRTIAAGLATHAFFPAGTNVELAAVTSPHRMRILIWERGVGPTEASGTGACGAAVAAVHLGHAAFPVEVEAPGGTQRVELADGQVWLTGWAEVTAVATWWGRA